MPFQDFDRRRFLVGGSGLMLLAGIVPTSVWAKPTFKENPFSLGVAAGDPAADGFVIWTRLAPKPLQPDGGMRMQPVAVQWEVAEDDKFARIARSGETLALPDLAHSVHVEVEGLKPGRPYWYRFTVKGAARSDIGTARTAPASGVMAERLRIGLVGCQRYEIGYYGAYRDLAQQPDLDAIFHYGDYIYVGHGNKGAKVNGTEERALVRRAAGDQVFSIGDFRQRYAQYKLDPDLQAAHAAAAFITSYDDGEVANDFAGDYDQKDTPPEVFALRRLAAMQAWYEHTPIRKAQFPHPSGFTMYRRLDYGNLMRINVLDTRAHRVDGGRPAGAVPTMLGARQEAWLADGLRSDVQWNFIAQQILVMPFNQKVGKGIGWNPRPESRARLVKSITDRGLNNVVIASGGAHQHFIGNVPVRDEAPDGAIAASEFHGTSISSAGDGEPHRPESKDILDRTPNLAFINAQRGYQLFDVSPKEWRTSVKVIDRVQTQGGKVSDVGSFVVEQGRAGVQRA